MDKSKDRKSASAIVKKSEFSKLQNKVDLQGKTIETFSRGQTLFATASTLTTPSGIFGAVMGLSRFVPGAAIAISAATIAIQQFQAQFKDGGTRDTRKKCLQKTFLT